MSNCAMLLDDVRQVLRVEAAALLATAMGIDESIEGAVNLVERCESKVIFTGVGKSAIIAHKLASTYCSLGIPATFMHASDGPHGDLGMITQRDCVFFLSLSGENSELFGNFATIKQIGCPTACITGSADSTLARACEVVLRIIVPSEAGDLAVAPTASAVAMMGLGDAIGLAVAKRRGLTLAEFARFHPGGALGRRLLTRVADLAHADGCVTPESGLLDVVAELTRSRLGAVAVIADGKSGKELLGLITEGDFRRAVGKAPENFALLKAREVMSKDPTTIDGDALAVDALRTMEGSSSQLSVLPVVSKLGYLGLVRIHDLLSFT